MKNVLGKIVEGLFALIAWICIPFAMLFGAISGLIGKARCRRYRTFTRSVDGIGEFQSMGTSVRDCKCWTHTFDFGPFRSVELALSGKVLKDKKQLAVVTSQFISAIGNAESVIEAIRKDYIYMKALEEGQDTLTANDEVYAELSSGDRNCDSPYMSVFYSTGKYRAWFSVQDGEMTSFDLLNE